MSEVRPPPPPPPPDGGAGRGTLSPSEQRNWAVAAHLSAFLGAWVLVAFTGPLVVWLLVRDRDAFAASHAREALNFNLSFLLYLAAGTAAGVVVSVLTLGLAVVPLVFVVGVVAVGWIVLTILAAVAASDGRRYRYPLTIRFVS